MRSTSWTPYIAVLGGAVTCYAALGAVLRVVPTYVPGQLGGGPLGVGVAVGAPSVTGALLRPMGGHWADRLGPRRLVLIGALVMALGALPALIANLPMLLVSRLVVGAGEALMMSASVLWLLRIAGSEHRGRSLGHIGLANYGGLTIGPLLVSLLGAEHHVERLWALAVALPLVAAAATLLVGSGSPPSVDRQRQRQRQEGIAMMVRRTGRPGVGLLLVNIGYVAVLSFGAIVVAAHGLAIGAAIVPVFGVGVIISRLGLGSLPDRLGARLVLLVSALVEAAGLAVFAVAGSTGLSIGALLVLSVGQGLAVPALGVLAIEGVPGEQQGAAAGAFFAWFDGGVGLGGPLVGAVAHVLSPQSAIVAAAVAVAAVVPVVLVRGSGRSAEPPADQQVTKTDYQPIPG